MKKELEKAQWRVWVDTGGTFTDCLAVDPEGAVHRAKVLSNSCLRARLGEMITPCSWTLDSAWSVPAHFLTGALLQPLRTSEDDAGAMNARVIAQPHPCRVELDRPLPDARSGQAVNLRFREQAPCLAARLVTATPSQTPLPPMSMRLATTRGTNALLERRGGKTALFLTQGLGDLLVIGTQQRPDLFSLRIEKPRPLSACVVEVHERLDADGQVVTPLDVDALRHEARELLARGVQCAAVALMHAYRNPVHELAVRDVLVELGFEFVSCSSMVAPLIKILPRAQTTLVDAYLAPVIQNYVRDVEAALDANSSLRVMTSAGGMIASNAFLPKDSLLSGPAGGVVGAQASAEAAGQTKIVSFDMGGTSTDVARIDRDFEYVFEHRVGDATVVAPALAVESVAAGGGSICRFDGYRLRVGPESAGAHPGPACYGAGGPLTVTDVNLLLGRLVPDRFEIPIDGEAASALLDDVLFRLREAGQPAVDSTRVLEGFLQIANERMADAVRRISLRKGYDPSEHALVAFGGAGGQAACAVATLLNMGTIVVPKDAGLLSARGLGRARIQRFAQRQLLTSLAEARSALERWRDELAERAESALLAEQVPASTGRHRRTIVHMRFRGQDTTVAVDFDPSLDLEEAFLARYESLYGYRPADGELEVESMRVVVAADADASDLEPVGGDAAVSAPTTQRACFHDRWSAVPVVERNTLRVDTPLVGPAIVVEAHGTTVVEPGWTLELHRSGALLLRKTPDIRR